MVKSELRNGNFVELRNGELLLVCNERGCEKYLVSLTQEKIILLDDNYNENLQSYSGQEEDIVTIYEDYKSL